MDSPAVRIDFLKNQAQHAETIASWVFNAWGDGTPEGRARASARVAERLRDDAVPLTLVAVEGELALGTVSLFEEDLAGWGHLTPWLAALYVDSGARNRGVGTALVGRVLRVAGDLGYEKVYLQAQEARDFYEDLGWRTIGQLRTDRGDTVVMEHDIRPLPVLPYVTYAGERTGLGHVMHAIRLDQALRERGIAQIRVVGDFGDSVGSLLEDRGMLRPLALPKEADVARHLLEADLSTSPVLVNLPKEGLEQSEPVFEALRAAGRPQIHFDDPMRTGLLADLLINALPHVDWGVDFSTHPNAHEGLDYLLLDRDFVAEEPRVRTGPVQTTLVSMGGGDAPNTTAAVLEALATIGFEGDADVVVGAANPHGASLAELASHMSFEVRFHEHLPSLAALVSHADLAFSALGVTTYEFASAGLPTAVIAGNELNGRVADLYSEQGTAVSLGYYRELSATDLASGIQQVLEDEAGRTAMSERGPKLVDGRGTDRVCTLIKELLDEETNA